MDTITQASDDAQVWADNNGPIERDDQAALDDAAAEAGETATPAIITTTDLF